VWSEGSPATGDLQQARQQQPSSSTYGDDGLELQPTPSKSLDPHQHHHHTSYDDDLGPWWLTQRHMVISTQERLIDRGTHLPLIKLLPLIQSIIPTMPPACRPLYYHRRWWCTATYASPILHSVSQRFWALIEAVHHGGQLSSSHIWTGSSSCFLKLRWSMSICHTSCFAHRWSRKLIQLLPQVVAYASSTSMLVIGRALMIVFTNCSDREVRRRLVRRTVMRSRKQLKISWN
jgi:hypothetical protein